MTDQTSALEAPMTDAVETLVTRLEHEHAWASELREDLAHTEKNIARLLTSVDSALELVPREERLSYRIRCARVHLNGGRTGRPPRDARNGAMLRYLADRGGETVGNAELRLHLAKEGLKATAKYIHATLANWASEGIVTRVAHGCYQVSAGHPRLMTVRMPAMDATIRETIEREKADRFEAMAEADREKAEEEARREIDRKRMLPENRSRPRSEWDPDFVDTFLMETEAPAAEDETAAQSSQPMAGDAPSGGP